MTPSPHSDLSRLQHEETELCGIIVHPGEGDTAGGDTVALQDIQAVRFWVEFIREFIYDPVHIGGENFGKMALRVVERIAPGDHILNIAEPVELPASQFGQPDVANAAVRFGQISRSVPFSQIWQSSGSYSSGRY